MENLLANLDVYVMYALSIVGALTLVVRSLSELAKLTKTEKDDAFFNKLSAALEGLANVINTFTPAAKPDKLKEPE